MSEISEKELWQATTELLGHHKLSLSPHWSYNFRNDPKRLAFVLSRYKFAAKMIGKRNAVLELGCSEGIGATLLAEQTEEYVGIDLDREAIDAAKKNLTPPKFSFYFDDFMGKTFGQFDAVVSLDVVEHIHKEHEEEYFQTVFNNLAEHGVAIIGTPNETADAYASEASKLGHVNLYTQSRLIQTLKQWFHQVLPFGMNDEIAHTGFASMSHYILCIACHKKEQI